LVPANYTPTKGRALYRAWVPQEFISIARSIARPRLQERKLMLPNPNSLLRLCNGARYGGLAAVGDDTPLRNTILAGPVDTALHAVTINGVNFPWRPLVFSSLHRLFDGIPGKSLDKVEGLLPQRFCAWSDDVKSFVYTHDMKDKFDEEMFRQDTLFCPIELPLMPAPPEAPADPRPADAARAAWDAAFVANRLAEYPDGIQWLGNNRYLNKAEPVSRSQVKNWVSLMVQASVILTSAYCQTRHFASMGSDLSVFQLPERGIVDEIKDIRTLVNDYGTKPSIGKQTESKSKPELTSAETKRWSGQKDVASGGTATSEFAPPGPNPDSLRSSAPRAKAEAKAKPKTKSKRGPKR